MTEKTKLEDASLPELQATFDELNIGVKVAEPQVSSMKQTYEEAQMILDDMKRRRGQAAYWLTIRKGQR